MSKFGELAIARVEDNSLTVLDTGPFESKADALSVIDEKLHNGERGNTLQLIRLDSCFEAREVTRIEVAEVGAAAE